MVAAVMTSLGAAACTPQAEPPAPPTPPEEALLQSGSVAFGASEIRLFDADLIAVNARAEAEIVTESEAYAALFVRCLAAGKTLSGGYSFLRPVLTRSGLNGDTTAAEGVFALSAERPDGPAPLDAAVVVADCEARNIPVEARQNG